MNEKVKKRLMPNFLEMHNLRLERVFEMLYSYNLVEKLCSLFRRQDHIKMDF